MTFYQFITEFITHNPNLIKQAGINISDHGEAIAHLYFIHSTGVHTPLDGYTYLPMGYKGVEKFPDAFIVSDAFKPVYHAEASKIMSIQHKFRKFDTLSIDAQNPYFTTDLLCVLHNDFTNNLSQQISLTKNNISIHNKIYLDELIDPNLTDKLNQMIAQKLGEIVELNSNKKIINLKQDIYNEHIMKNMLEYKYNYAGINKGMMEHISIENQKIIINSLKD